MINAAAATLRGVGAVLILLLVSPTVRAFFIWQIVVGLLHTAAVAIALWRRIGGTSGASFDAPLLRTVWRFAAGMMGISILSAALGQLDKMILSKVLSLSAFGYYSFAGAVAAGLYRIVTPIYSAVFPRFSQFVADDDERGLATLYHQVAQTIVVVVVPAAVFVAFFSHEILLVWTRDPVLADSTDGILALLILGTAVNGVLTIPYAVQLAYGWTRLVVLLNIVAVIVLVPTVLLLTLRFGAPGAAFGWLAYNVAAAIVVPALMHARVLRGELFTWYLRDVGIPTAAAVLAAAAARAIVPLRSDDLFFALLRLGAVACLVQCAALFGVPRVRTFVLSRLRGPVGVFS